MLTLLLGLLDRLVKLAEVRNETMRRIFEDHVNPIFQDLRVVYDDYRAIVAKVQMQLSDRTVSVQAIANDLRSQREKNLRLRDELRRYSGALQNVRTAELREFVHAATNLLRREPTTPDTEHTMMRGDSPVYQLIQDVEQAYSPADALAKDSREESRLDLIEIVGRFDGVVNRAWEDVSRVYYHLRASLQ